MFAIYHGKLWLCLVQTRAKTELQVVAWDSFYRYSFLELWVPTSLVHCMNIVFFCVQCNGEAESTAWSCYATADLRILPQKEGVEVFSRSEYYFLLVSRMIDLQVHLHWICWTLCFAEIHHLFYLKENDWGFSHFMQLSDVLDPAKGYIKDDTIILEVSYLRVFCSPVLHKT